MTQHSQNGEGVEARAREVLASEISDHVAAAKVGAGVDRLISTKAAVRAMIAFADEARQSLACEPATADVERGNPIETAPTNGTMIRLLVDYTDGGAPLEDAQTAWTIGFNNLANTGEARWQFAGWCWTHDHFCEGSGTAVGWLPWVQAIEGRRSSTRQIATELTAYRRDQVDDEYITVAGGLIDDAIAALSRAAPSSEPAMADVGREAIRAVTAEMRRFMPNACGDWADKIDAAMLKEKDRKVAFYDEPGHDIRPGETLPDRDRRIYQQGRHDAVNDEPEAFI